MTLYIETSAVLSWLFRENKSYQVQKAIEHAELVVTSALTIAETNRSISRVLFQKLIKESQSKQLKKLFTDTVSGWEVYLLTTEILERAGLPFPVEPIRTLDALHERIIKNLDPLGLIEYFV